MKNFAVMIGLLFAIALRCQAGDASPVTACATDVDAPPYLFAGASENNAKEQGIGVDVLQEVLRRLHLESAPLRRLPWARCLNEVTTGKIDIAINVQTAQVDPAPYWVTDSYMDVHSVYIYAKAIHPAGLKVESLHDLKRFRVCGLFGTRYDAFGLAVDQIDDGSRDYVSVFGKIGAGRCDMAIEKSAVLDGLLKRDKQLRQLYESAQLARGKMPEDEMLGLHFVISRKMAGGDLLRNAINREIRNMKKSNRMENIFAKYL